MLPGSDGSRINLFGESSPGEIGMVRVTIDGNNISVPAGTTILQAAAQLGVTIPTLCWLEKVSPTGACRICAVEVAGVDRTMTACNTPVKEGIVVTTQSDRLTAIRTKIMELMLVNHPLDCPVCDAGGECDLQDNCYGLEVTKQEFSAQLERRPIRYDWKLLESDPNRCILCEKCVKVDHEIVGCDAIKIVNKGEATIIDTVDGKPLECDFCGNCIAACPTGTLISKPFKFRGRPWTFSTTKSICPFCSVGCQIEYHTKEGRVGRVTSEDATYNNGNLCINGRFGYSMLEAPERLKAPLVRTNPGALAETDWHTALSRGAEALNSVLATHGPGAIAGIGSPRLTNEESYLFQKFLRQTIGTPHIDSEARFGYAPAQQLLVGRLGFYGASAPIDHIDNADAVIVLGSDLKAEATGLEYRVIKAVTKHDARLIVAGNRPIKLKKYANTYLQHKPGTEAAMLSALLLAIDEIGSSQATALPGSAVSLAECAAICGIDPALFREAASLLDGKKRVAILYGADIMRGADAEASVSLLSNLVIVTGALGKEAGGLFPVDEKNNTQGMLDMGVAPTLLPGGVTSPTTGRNLWQILEGIEKGEIKALYLIGADPVTSFPAAGRFKKALEKLELLIVQDIVATATSQLAHIVFPGAAAAEKEGSFTTPDHRVQCLNKAVNPPGSARADLEIINELNARCSGKSVSATTVATILNEIKEATGGLYTGECQTIDGRCTGLSKALWQPKDALSLISALSLKSCSDPLQLQLSTSVHHNGTMTSYSENNLTASAVGYFEISPADAASYGIADGVAIKVTSSGGTLTGNARISDTASPGLIVAPGNFRDFPVAALLTGSANLVPVTIAKT